MTQHFPFKQDTIRCFFFFIFFNDFFLLATSCEIQAPQKVVTLSSSVPVVCGTDGVALLLTGGMQIINTFSITLLVGIVRYLIQHNKSLSCSTAKICKSCLHSGNISLLNWLCVLVWRFFFCPSTGQCDRWQKWWQVCHNNLWCQSSHHLLLLW